MKKRAIFVLGKWSKAGGLEIVTQQFVGVFRKAGYDITVLAVGSRGRDESAANFKVRYMLPPGRILQSLWHRFFKYRVTARHLRKLVSPGDMVVFGHVYLLPVLDRCELPEGVTSWVWTHDKEVWGDSAIKWKPWLDKLSRIISVSEYTARNARAGGTTTPVTVIPNSIDIRRYVPTTTPEKIRRDEILICSRIPTDFRYKGHERLLRTIPKVEHILGRKITLRIVGGGAGLDELKQLAHKYGISDRVIFTGRVSDDELLEAYQHCGVFCMPSTGEGFGLVYAETEACARPVVVSTFGGAPETVIDGETGLLADPNDIEANARALAKILGNPELADEMGRKGRALAERSFSPETFERNVLKVIEEDV